MLTEIAKRNTPKHLLVLILLLAMSALSYAQNTDKDKEQNKDKYKITGQVIETENYAPVENASVQLLSADSVFINGVTTNDNGNFTTYIDKKGSYKVRISFLGYKTLVKNFEVKSRNTSLDILRLDADSIMLEGTTVTAALPKMQMVGDTLLFNADAYHMPDGSVLEELIERLPGAEINDGKITINSKEIKKIMLDGKEFFTGNTETATKNLPTDIIDKLKVYDEKSEMAKVTGIDDGNDQPVIDVRIKKGMNRGYMLNGDAAYGTHDRYSGRVNASEFGEKNRLTLVANGSNTSNGRATPGRGSGGGGGQGLRSSESLGANYNYSDKGTNGRKDPTLQMSGNANYTHGTTDRQTRSSSTNYEKKEPTYSNSNSANLSKNHGFNGSFRVEWRPDTLTNIQFSPSWSYSNNDNMSTSTSMQFSDNPFDYSETPLDLYQNFDDQDGIRTNYRSNQNISHSENRKVGGWLQYNRRFGNMGRNLTFRVDASYSKNKSENVSNNLTHLYKVKDQWGNDSVYYTNRYSTTPSHNYNYSAQVTYSEPLMRATFLQFSYKFTFTKNESDQSTYDFSALGENFGNGAALEYGGFSNYIGAFSEDDMEYYKNHNLSRYSRYENYDHDAQMLFRIIRTHYNFSTGVNVRPQRSHFVQDYHGVYTDTIRNIVNINPTMNLQIRFSKQHTLKLDFHGNSTQPSISQLLDITNDNDPLNISKGNPGLKPSWTNNLNMQYANYLMDYKFNIALNGSYSTTSNSISTKVTYDDVTGGRITQPENINGNWRTNASLTLNKSWGNELMLNLTSSSNYSYNHQVSYYTVDRQSSSQINTTNNTTLSERLSAGLRNTWLELSANGSVNANQVRNLLQEGNNRNTYRYQYGGSVNIRFPWNMVLDTSISQNLNRGYSDATANTNELIWNAQLSQSFFRGKALTLSVQVYDILGQQKSFNYNVSATRTSETHYNSITQYVMFHVVFNLRSFGGKAARDARRERREWNREGGERPEGFPGGRPEGGFGGPGGGGGFGGSRPGGGFGGGGPR